MIGSPWLTVIEAASLARVSEKTIRKGVASGALRHIRPGGPRGNIRIHAGVLLDWTGPDRTDTEGLTPTD